MSGLFGAPCDGNLKNVVVFFYSSRRLFRYRMVVFTFSVKRKLNVFLNVRLPSFLTNRARLWLHSYIHSIKKKKKFVTWDLMRLSAMEI